MVHLKVRKLAHVGVPAIWVSEVDRDSLYLVAAGNFHLVCTSLVETLQCLHCTIPAMIVINTYSVHVPWDSSQVPMERALFKDPVPATCSYGCHWWGALHPWVVRACVLYHTKHLGYMCHIALCRGPDFRTAFHKIGGLRALTKIPFMCLTASASPQIELEIVDSVGFINPVFVKKPINRPNTCYYVIKKSSMQVSICIASPQWRICINLLVSLAERF